MSPLRFFSLALLVISGGAFFGCSLFGDDESKTSSSTTGTGATGGGGSAGGMGGSGGTGGTGGATTSGAGGFPTDCKDHTDVPENTCSMLKQDCGKGEACRPNDFGTDTTCEGVAGVKGMSAPCGSDNECALGLFCVFNLCSPVCCPKRESEFCGSGQCNVSISFGMQHVWACSLSKTCALFDSMCPEGQQCRLGDLSQERSLCTPMADPTAAEGEDCKFLNNCGEAQVCNNAKCRYSCLNTGWETLEPGKGGCPMGQNCVQQTTKYGVCNPP